MALVRLAVLGPLGHLDCRALVEAVVDLVLLELQVQLDLLE